MAIPKTDKVSQKQVNISGIQCTIYGLSELAPSVPVDCLWLLHRRRGDYTQMESFANRIISCWTANPLSKSRGLIAIAFDHRNHGGRVVNALNNCNWTQGNVTAAADFISVFHGTADDVSFLIDYIDPYVFGDADQGRTASHMVLGASLGGHSAWHCALWDKRIKDVVSVIGCPDYIHLMQGRAQNSELIPKDSQIVGTKYFPTTLRRAVEKHDPYCQFVEAEMSKAELRDCIDDKRILCLSGGQDTLVPHERGQRFRDWFAGEAAQGGKLDGIKVQFRDVIDDEAEHKFTDKMEGVAEEFLVECLAQRAEGKNWLEQNPTFGLSTKHI